MKVNFDTIYNHVVRILDESLPDHLTYHSTEHTKYVVQLSEYIGKKEGLDDSEIFLIKVAALYHDMGFIISPKDHEENSCALAKEQLPKFNFSAEEIKKICGMIMATKIPQNPQNLSEKVLADADLEYLSTKNFYPISEQLYQELKHDDPSLTRNKWNKIQIAFIKDHSYHTDYCKRYKEFRKRKILDQLAKTAG